MVHINLYFSEVNRVHPMTTATSLNLCHHNRIGRSPNLTARRFSNSKVTLVSDKLTLVNV